MLTLAHFRKSHFHAATTPCLKPQDRECNQQCNGHNNTIANVRVGHTYQPRQHGISDDKHRSNNGGRLSRYQCLPCCIRQDGRKDSSASVVLIAHDNHIGHNQRHYTQEPGCRAITVADNFRHGEFFITADFSGNAGQ